jgi:CubicO group peptidase (beta-lactamase class C family)
MTRREFMTLLTGAAALPLPARAQQPPLIDQQLGKAVADKTIAGVVAIATDRKGVIYRGAFGAADVATGRPMTLDTLFRIASMTKAITSTAAMQQIEAGRFGLDDPVAKFLPDFAHLSVIEAFNGASGDYRLRPATRAVTVRHLMTHTSGFGYPFTSAILRDFKPRAGDPPEPLLFEPGERWHYGTSTDWLGRLIERVSGETLEIYFRRHIFDPLKMPDTFYSVPADKQARLAAVHRRAPDGGIVKDANQPPPTIAMPIGGGGLASTADDYARFLRMLLNGGEFDGARVLSAATVELMGQNHIGALVVPALASAMPERSANFTFVADGRDKWGLGFLITADHVPGKRSAGSLSWGGINNTYFWVDPARGVAGVILMQFLPFADPKALAVYDTFERGIYSL